MIRTTSLIDYLVEISEQAGNLTLEESYTIFQQIITDNQSVKLKMTGF